MCKLAGSKNEDLTTEARNSRPVQLQPASGVQRKGLKKFLDIPENKLKPGERKSVWKKLGFENDPDYGYAFHEKSEMAMTDH